MVAQTVLVLLQLIMKDKSYFVILQPASVKE